MSKSRFMPRLWIIILLAILFAVSLYLRVALPYDQVFIGDSVKYTTHDAYHYMRQVDSVVHNFPHLISFDPYTNYPHGAQTGTLNLFVYLLSGIVWLIGLGSPTENTVNMVGVYFPAVLGALTIIPVYFIGKALFNRGTGIVAAALIAILPGEFLGRSILGATDRDALQVLLSSFTMMFLIMAIKTAREKQLTFQRPSLRYSSVLARPIIYSLLSGILLGLSLLTWRGAFLFVLIILVYFIIQSIINHFKRKSSDYLGFVGIVTFLVALLLFWAASPSQLYRTALAIPILVLLTLSCLAWLLARNKVRPIYYPLSILGIGLLSLGIFFIVSPSLLKSMLGQFSVFIPTITELTILEMRPILFPYGEFSLAGIWGNYTTGFILSLISLGMLVYLAIKRGETNHVLLVVWSLIMLAATLALRRMAIFFTINVALLTSYLTIVIYYIIRFIIDYMAGKSTDYASSQIVEMAGFRALAGKPSKPSKERDYYEVLGLPRNATKKQIKKAYQELVSKYKTTGDLTDRDEERFGEISKAHAVLSDHRKRAAYDRSQYDTSKKERDKAKPRKRGRFQISTSKINMAVASLLIFFLVFFPNIRPATTVANDTPLVFAPSNAWYESLSWLKDNTAEPFGEASFYYDLYQPPFYYPDTAYGIAAWWDYGYWIIRIGHRLPNCYPGGGKRGLVAKLFVAQDEASAQEIINKLNSKYIIIDTDITSNKFHAVATYAGSNIDQFWDVYYLPIMGKLIPIVYYYPEYYQSLVMRLYHFDGNEVTTESCNVISYVEKVTREGENYKEIANTQSFPTFEEAVAYISKQASGNHRIASSSAFASPMPIERLKQFKLVYASTTQEWLEGIGNVPSVKIFEYNE